MRLPASKPGILGEHIMEINSNGLKERTQYNEGTVKWAGVIKILSNKSYIFIYIDNMVGYIVPKRAFTTEKEEEKFLSVALEMWKNNK